MITLCERSIRGLPYIKGLRAQKVVWFTVNQGETCLDQSAYAVLFRIYY